MSIVYFTLVAVLLYWLADWVLERIEVRAGKRLQHRSLIFFAVLLSMALVTFSMLGAYLA